MARGMDTGRTLGGILRLLEIRSSHPAEMAYDFRSRFSISAWEIGRTITWLEAVYLVNALLRDPSSFLQAAVNKWKYPVSHEWIALTHIYDLLAIVNSKRKPKPHAVPWLEKNKTQMGFAKNRSRKDVIRALRRMNPDKE